MQISKSNVSMATMNKHPQAYGATRVNFGNSTSDATKLFKMINSEYWGRWGSRYPQESAPTKLAAAKLAHSIEERLSKGEKIETIAETMNAQLKSSGEAQRHAEQLNLLSHTWEHGRAMLDAHNALFKVKPGAESAITTNRFSF